MSPPQQEMQVQLLCNCGLLVSCGADTVLIDAPNAAHRTFQVMDAAMKKGLEAGDPPFDRLRGLVFTHTHPDHCDLEAAHRYLRLHPACTGFIPSYDDPACVRLACGGVRLELHYLPHMPVPEGMKKHYVLLLECGGRTLYITGDAAPEPQLHAAVLANRHIDAAFWNPYHLIAPQMHEWITAADVRQHCVYHIPADEKDTTGIRRKLLSCVGRHPDRLGSFRLLTRYPAIIPIT